MIMEWMSILNKNILLHKIDVSVNIHFALTNYDNVDLCFARSKKYSWVKFYNKKTMWMHVQDEHKKINAISKAYSTRNHVDVCPSWTEND